MRIKPGEDGAQIKGTVQSWSDSLGIDPGTLKRKMNLAGIKFEVGKKLDAIDVFRALTVESAKETAATRKLQADAESRERENRRKAGELVELPMVERLVWNELLQPLKQELEQMPRLLAGNCNPQEPGTAEAVLVQWVETTKSKLNPK